MDGHVSDCREGNFKLKSPKEVTKDLVKSQKQKYAKKLKRDLDNQRENLLKSFLRPISKYWEHAFDGAIANYIATTKKKQGFLKSQLLLVEGVMRHIGARLLRQHGLPARDENVARIICIAKHTQFKKPKTLRENKHAELLFFSDEPTIRE